jgi:hypothetical protein
MPAKSKQQQKFFGVVKAMQKGDIPKKGEAGEVAKDMSKKEVDKYAGTKHKGLPKKVKKETMKISDIKKMVKEELVYVLENLNDPILKKLRTLPKGNLLPPINKWWEAQPEDLLGAIYWSKGQLPPREPAKFEKAYNDIVKQLHVKYPIPAEVLPKLDLDDETEKAIMMDAPDMNEAKMTPAKVQKAQKELVATIQLLKKNFPMYKKAKDSGDEKKLAKHREIAIKLTKKKKQLEIRLDQALGGLYQDAELKLTEALARGLKPLLMLGSKVSWNTMSEDALLDLSKRFDDIDDEVAEDVLSYLNMSIENKQDGKKGLATKALKAFNKACKDALAGKPVKSVFEGKLTDINEDVYNDILKVIPDNYSYKNLAQDIADVIKDAYGSHNIEPFMKEISRALNENNLNEIAINDPVLVAMRAFKTQLKKDKLKPKPKKISMNKYYKLMDMESDLIDQMKDAAKELAQLNSDMNAEAGQKGDAWSDADANRYGGDLDKLQTKYEKLAKQKAKVKKAIMDYRIS